MASTPADALLAKFVECADSSQSEALLEELVVAHALPGIRKVVRYKLAFQGRSEAQDVEDVAGEVMVEIIGRLRAIKEGGTDAIGSFSGYAAVAAYHACNEYLRRKYPNRHRLKNRLRYLLNTNRLFAVWEGGADDWLCGLSRWQRENTAPAGRDHVSRWRDLLGDLPHGEDAMHPTDLLGKIFERLGGPVEFDEVVGMLAWLWGVEDPVAVPENAAREVDSGDAHPGLRFELAQWLRELWKQIRELPLPQRVALLLNLRSGPNTPAAALLPATGTASVAEIAEILGFGVEEFARVWNNLPLEDLAIAQYLGVTRQQVINLRKSARDRLTRRMGAKDRTPGPGNMRAGSPSNRVTR